MSENQKEKFHAIAHDLGGSVSWRTGFREFFESLLEKNIKISRKFEKIIGETSNKTEEIISPKSEK